MLSESMLDHHLEPVEEDPSQFLGHTDQPDIGDFPQVQENNKDVDLEGDMSL